MRVLPRKLPIRRDRQAANAGSRPEQFSGDDFAGRLSSGRGGNLTQNARNGLR